MSDLPLANPSAVLKPRPLHQALNCNSFVKVGACQKEMPPPIGGGIFLRLIDG